MPVRSSICTYSPSASSSKYSSASPSSLSIGHYKPLSSLTTASASTTSTTGSGYLSSARPSSTIGASRYLTSSSSYSPAAYSTLPSNNGLSSSAYQERASLSSASHYRPLNSAHTSFSASRHLTPNIISSSSSSSGSSAYGSGSGVGRYSSSTGASSSSSSSLSSAGSSLLERTENLLSTTASSSSSSSGYSSSTIGNYNTYHPSSPSSSASRRRISRTSFDGTSSTDSLSLPSTYYRSPRQQQRQPQHEKLPDEVPKGLVNLGNTCYMNSAIQSLYAIESFRNLILRSTNSANTYDKPLLMELCSLFKTMKESSVPLSPRNFHIAFSRRHQSKFTEYHQQDAQEFLRYLINSVHEECNRVNQRPRNRSTVSPRAAPKSAEEAWGQYREIVDDSPFVDLLVGQMCSTIVCSNCQNKSLCWDPFWDLSLAIQRGHHYGHSYGGLKLSDVLDDFCAKETLDSDERPICGQCKKATRSTKQIKLSRLPKLLILHLKKFSNDGYKLTSHEVKIDKQLTFNEDTTYCLSACISHHGHSSSSGHYTSHCKYSTNWFHFNDDRVRDVTSSFDSTKLDDAYVLFYTQQPSATAAMTTRITSKNNQSKL